MDRAGERASGRAVQGLGDRVWVGWDVGLVEYQCEGVRKGIAKCLVHLRMKQLYLLLLILINQLNSRLNFNTRPG